MGKYLGSEWSPSEWYQWKATPTQKKLIKRHIDGKHTKYCMVYDSNYHGIYCKWLTYVFWPKIYFTKAVDLVESSKGTKRTIDLSQASPTNQRERRNK